MPSAAQFDEQHGETSGLPALPAVIGTWIKPVESAALDARWRTTNLKLGATIPTHPLRSCSWR
jgi:hypothetical protein